MIPEVPAMNASYPWNNDFARMEKHEKPGVLQRGKTILPMRLILFIFTPTGARKVCAVSLDHANCHLYDSCKLAVFPDGTDR